MPSVVILYDSRGGNTRAMAEAVADGVRLVPNVECRLMPAAEIDMDALAAAGALAIGSPNYYTYPTGRIKTFFDLAYGRAPFKAKPYAAFSTHGGGGGISAIIDKLATALGLKKLADGIDICGAPAGDQLKDCRHLGQVVARAAANA